MKGKRFTMLWLQVVHEVLQVVNWVSMIRSLPKVFGKHPPTSLFVVEKMESMTDLVERKISVELDVHLF